MKRIAKLYQREFPDFGTLILRIGLGIYMLKASGSYLFEGKMGELIVFLESLNWPIPYLLAPLSQGVEFVSAILVLSGIRLGAFAMAFTLLVAVVFAHGGRILEDGQLPFMLASCFLALGLIGSGRYSMDNYLFERKRNL